MKAPGFVRRRLARRRFSGQKFTEATRLIASVAVAAAVTAGMVGIDALTRDTIPTPAETDRVEVEVRSTTFIPAVTASGRRRQRARFAVGLRVTNITDRPLPLGELGLLVAAAAIKPDLNAADVAGTLLAPLKPRGVAQGELRYETAGAITRGLIAGQPLRLRVAGETVPLKSPDRAASQATPGGSRDGRQPKNPRVRVEVRSITLLQASSASGRRRERARLSVRLRVTNTSGRRLLLGEPRLLAGGATVRADPNARAAARTLLAALESRGVAQGVLRFETAGAATRSLAAGRRPQLRIAGMTVPLRRPAQPRPSDPADTG